MNSELEQSIILFFGRYSWVFILGLFALFFKGAIDNLYKGLLVFLGSNIQNDDIILYKGRKARVVRKGIFKTVIYIQEGNTKIAVTKLVITNSELKSSDIEILIDQDYDKLN